MFHVSLSAVQTFQRCETRYHYQYVRGLRQRVKDLAPQRGIVLHDYLENYYTLIAQLPDGDTAHITALLGTLEKYGPRLAAAAQAAFMMGDEVQAAEYNELPAVVERIANRYYLARGQADAQRYVPLLVEERVSVKLSPDIVSAAVVDMVLRDKQTGRVGLVEHKSTANVPQTSVRLRDFQTILYADILRAERGINIDYVLWNYLSTKEPTVPEQLKTGGLTHAKNIDTTWEIYAHALAANGLPEDQYQDMRERLEGRELTRFFPRYEQVIVADSKLLIRDYITQATRIAELVDDWHAGVKAPIRHLSRDCDYCPFYKLCEATLMGGDAEDLVHRYFTVSPPHRDDERAPEPEPAKEEEEEYILL